MRQLVDKLMSDSEARHWFSSPVDLNQYPDYRQKVKRPIDLRTISHRLHPSSGTQCPYHESTASVAYEDIRRVFTNAVLYTPDSLSPVHKAASRLLKIVDTYPTPLPLPPTPSSMPTPSVVTCNTTPEADRKAESGMGEEDEEEAERKAEKDR